MPAGQPFTALCRSLARPPAWRRADLHVHTTASDGLYTPAQVVELARRSGLAAVAITDHDTLAGVGPARNAVADTIEVIAGVEITAEHHERELHLLGYFVNPDNIDLNGALARLLERRVLRFQEMVDRLASLGVHVDPLAVAKLGASTAPGRRHLAELLVREGKAGSIQEAFQRWLGDRGRVAAPKTRLPVAEAIAHVRHAGGVASWAHPFYDATREQLAELRALGLHAVEVEFPSCRPSQSRQLRSWASELGLAVTGGSDCHGPGGRGLGSSSISAEELAALRELI